MLQDGTCQGMHAVRFQRRGMGEQVTLGMTVEGEDFLHRRAPMGQRARLVESDDAEACRGLQVRPAFDQHAPSGRGRESCHDAHRCGDDQGTGTGNDQDDQRFIEPRPPRTAEQQWGQHGNEHGQGQHGRSVDPGELFHPLLARGAPRVGLLHQVDNARQRCIRGTFGRLEGKGAVAVDRPGVHLVTSGFRDGL